jgi:putative transposase
MEPQAECMLILIGATPEGKKELIGFQTGMRESVQSWKELLVDLKARGLSIAPEVAVGDGALGFWKALDEAFPSTRHQRCWLHKTLNVLDKFPKSVQPNAHKDHDAGSRLHVDRHAGGSRLGAIARGSRAGQS